VAGSSAPPAPAIALVNRRRRLAMIVVLQRLKGKIDLYFLTRINAVSVSVEESTAEFALRPFRTRTRTTGSRGFQVSYWRAWGGGVGFQQQPTEQRCLSLRSPTHPPTLLEASSATARPARCCRPACHPRDSYDKLTSAPAPSRRSSASACRF